MAGPPGADETAVFEVDVGEEATTSSRAALWAQISGERRFETRLKVDGSPVLPVDSRVASVKP